MVEVTFQVHDFCGNTNPESHAAVFGVMGNSGPVLVQEPADLMYICTGSVVNALHAWLDSVGGAAVQEACENIDWTFSWEENGMTQTGMPGIGPYPGAESLNCETGLPVTFSATDLCDHTVMGTAGFFFSDSIAPEVVFDSVLTIPCDSLAGLSILATDNCTATPFIVFVDQTLNGDTTSCLNGTIIRTWTITDDCGNITTAVQTIHTEDLDAPSFIAPHDTILYCVDGEEVMSGEPMSVFDNCDPDPSVVFVDDISGSGCSITISRTWFVADACNNTQTVVQVITIIDTLAPLLEIAPSDLILECGSDATPQLAFLNWISSGAGASLVDNCGDVQYFIAVPGSYTLGDTSTWPGTAPNLPQMVCGNDTLGVALADFVYSDACGNAGIRALQILILDTTAPLFTQCTEDTVMLLDPGFCEGEITLTPPFAFDLCGAEKDTLDLKITESISSVTPGDSLVVVDTVAFLFDVPAAPARIMESVLLTIVLRQADIDSMTEYFNVLGDDGQALGITTNSTHECDSSVTQFVIPVDLINDWAFDGQLQITLVPNLSPGGADAINDICGGSTAEVSMQLISGIHDSLPLSYAVDTLPRVLLDSIVDVTFTLGAGVHTVAWYTTDCGGNEASCVTQVTMLDQDPPEIDCPDDMQKMIEDEMNCLVAVSLPFPEVKDSCGVDKSSAKFRIEGDTLISDT
jgi:hypothetical protein